MSNYFDEFLLEEIYYSNDKEVLFQPSLYLDEDGDVLPIQDYKEKYLY